MSMLQHLQVPILNIAIRMNIITEVRNFYYILLGNIVLLYVMNENLALVFYPLCYLVIKRRAKLGVTYGCFLGLVELIGFSEEIREVFKGISMVVVNGVVGLGFSQGIEVLIKEPLKYTMKKRSSKNKIARIGLRMENVGREDHIKILMQKLAELQGEYRKLNWSYYTNPAVRISSIVLGILASLLTGSCLIVILIHSFEQMVLKSHVITEIAVQSMFKEVFFSYSVFLMIYLMNLSFGVRKIIQASSYSADSILKVGFLLFYSSFTVSNFCGLLLGGLHIRAQEFTADCSLVLSGFLFFCYYNFLKCSDRSLSK